MATREKQPLPLAGTPTKDDAKRSRRIRPFPVYSLEQAMAVAQAIASNNACRPYSRLSLAESIGRSPEASQFRSLITSSSAYGLTEGGYQAPQISLTPLGLSIVAPKTDEERRQALIRAALNIELFNQLYKHFDQHRLPPHEHFRNTLIRDYNIDPSLADDCISQFRADGKFVGLIRQIAGADRVSIHDASNRSIPSTSLDLRGESGNHSEVADIEPETISTGTPPGVVVQKSEPQNNRVFITHGKNAEIVAQLKELLMFGKFTPVVAEEHETLSKPVPDKVLDDMRSCFAGIIHIAGEQELMDSAGQRHHKISENVLIEIGAAMALYHRRFILLVQKGVHLPSNLQGLYRCDYEGAKLDYEATMKLLKTFNEFNK